MSLFTSEYLVDRCHRKMCPLIKLSEMHSCPFSPKDCKEIKESDWDDFKENGNPQTIKYWLTVNYRLLNGKI